MNEINVQTSTHSYKVHIGKGLRFDIAFHLPKVYTSIMIITDEHVEKLYLEDVKKSFKAKKVMSAIIPAGEQSKSIQQFYELQTKAIQFGLNRQSLIVALGGGVVGDLAGFVAATFMRGIDYVQIPTTILAHDSSVGGKVAINHELGKNLIGNFYPPMAVIYDTDTIETLPQHEIRSGYAELVKEALISDVHFFDDIISIDLNDVSADKLAEHLQKGIQVKASIVESDEREAGIRKHLNLGHTLGHAIEAELGYGSMTHGEAIAIGMLFAVKLSESHFNIKLPYDSLLNWMKKNHYPTTLPNIDPKRLLIKMKSDKKVLNENIPMVLLSSVGQAVTIEFNDNEILIALQSFIKELS